MQPYDNFIFSENHAPTKPEATAFKGEVRRGMGRFSDKPHPHPGPPLEGEGGFLGANPNKKGTPVSRGALFIAEALLLINVAWQ